MAVNAKTTLGQTLAVTLSLALLQTAVPVQAAPHVAGQNQMTARLVEAAKSRQDKIELFQKALATPGVQARAQSMGLDANRISRAIPHLSDSELADLAQRATRAQDVAAGHRHGDGDAALVVLGVVLLLAAIVIIAAVASEGHWDDGCDCW
jgi:hypothetical protein